MSAPLVIWTPPHAVSEWEADKLRRAFAKHLRADFRVSTDGGDAGAILIADDFVSRIDVGGCKALIEDTLRL